MFNIHFFSVWFSILGYSTHFHTQAAKLINWNYKKFVEEKDRQMDRKKNRTNERIQVICYGMLDLQQSMILSHLSWYKYKPATHLHMVPIAIILHIVRHHSCTVHVITYDDTFLSTQSKLFIWKGMDLNIIPVCITDNRLEMIAKEYLSQCLNFLHTDSCKVHVHILNGSYEITAFQSTHTCKFKSELHV